MPSLFATPPDDYHYLRGPDVTHIINAFRHLIAYRGMYDRNAGQNLLTLFVVMALAAILLMLATKG